MTNWSGINGIPDETYFAIPRMPLGVLTNSAGFTNGDMFFGNGNYDGIGWISAGATRSNITWCDLTNSAIPYGVEPLRGGICIDETGTFRNNIIAVESPASFSPGNHQVWTVDSRAKPTLLAEVNADHLEGVTTLTNDSQQWGPWAGQVITGDEDTGTIYTITTNGVVTATATTTLVAGGIAPEDFKVIPPNSALYLANYSDSGNDAVVELPGRYFRNHIGDLLIIEAGEGQPGRAFIVHWNAQSTNFVTTQIPLPYGLSRFEHATFAPVEFPGL